MLGFAARADGPANLRSSVLGSDASPSEIALTPVLARLSAQERYLALEVQGTRHDLAVKYGLLMAQFALALDGADRENVLASLVDLLATRARTH